MKKLIFELLAVFLIFSVNLTAQNIDDSVHIEKNFGTEFVQNEKILRPNDMLEIMKVNSLAYEEMKTAKNYITAATIISSVGGFFIGYSLGYSLTSGGIRWVPAGIGFGLVAVSVPFSVSYTKHAKNAVKIFNEDLPYKSTGSLDINFGFIRGGAGLFINF